MATKLATIIADFSTSLATKIAVGGTTATLQSATDDDGVALPSGEYSFTLNGDNSQKEYIIATLSGTSLTAIKSVTRQGVQSSGTVREHRVGSSVTITNFTHIKYINDLLDGTTNLDADTPLEYDGTASITTANQLATKDYVDGVAIAGGADASTTVKGISKLSTAPVSATNPIAVGDNDTRVPTQDENDALQGTSGTPSNSNRYVTSDDTATTGADKVMRLKTDGLVDDANLSLTTAGDIVYSDGTDLSRLAIGTASQVLRVNSGATAPEWGTLVKQSVSATQVTVTNTTTETALVSYSVPANSLSTNNAIELWIPISDFEHNGAGGNELTLRLKYGSTTIASITTNYAAVAITGHKGWIRAMIIANSSTSAQRGNIETKITEAGYNSGGADEYFNLATGTATEDSTGALTLAVTAQWGDASTSNIITTAGYSALLNN